MQLAFLLYNVILRYLEFVNYSSDRYSVDYIRLFNLHTVIAALRKEAVKRNVAFKSAFIFFSNVCFFSIETNDR